MMIGAWWVPTSVMLWSYAVSNMLAGLLSLAAVVELPWRDPWLRVARWIVGVFAGVSIGCAAGAFKLVLLQSLSPDEAMWRLMGPMLLLRWLNVCFAAWGVAYGISIRPNRRDTTPARRPDMFV